VAIDRVPRVLLALCLLSGCHRGLPDLSNLTEEEATPPLAAEIQMADTRASFQLISGWYAVEQDRWRWTARKFSAVLRPPIGAVKSGAILTFDFTLPEAVAARLKTVTLAASIGGAQLQPQTYTRAGESVYARDVPARLISGHSVRIDFTLDKALPPGSDPREFGVIADRLRLETR
jgi:hypothetical protein